MNKTQLRKIASHRITFPDGHSLTFSVVTINGERVIDVHPMKSEEALTEWFPGTIFIDIDNQAIPHALYKGRCLTT